VRQGDIDDDSKEMMMGHVLKGSRQAYFDGKDVETMQKEYEKCNFTREVPKSEITKIREQLETSESKNARLEDRLNSLEAQYEANTKMLKELLDKKA
jgi:predicted nuclease with TOPRIM domain